MAITFAIPGDKEIGVAVNRGIPVTVASPRSPAAKVVRELAELLLPSGSTPSRSPHPARRRLHEARRHRHQAVRRPPEPPEGRHVEVLQVEGQEGGVN